MQLNGIINEAQLTPFTENKNGSDCSGSDGAADRTLTLSKSSILSNGIIVAIDGTSLHQGAGKDFTVSGNVLTFLNAVDDADEIRVVYFG